MKPTIDWQLYNDILETVEFFREEFVYWNIDYGFDHYECKYCDALCDTNKEDMQHKDNCKGIKILKRLEAFLDAERQLLEEQENYD